MDTRNPVLARPTKTPHAFRSVNGGRGGGPARAPEAKLLEDLNFPGSKHSYHVSGVRLASGTDLSRAPLPTPTSVGKPAEWPTRSLRSPIPIPRWCCPAPVLGQEYGHG